MVKIRTLVPLTHPTTDEHFAADTEIDVADDIAADWRAAGKCTLIEDEERNAQAAAEGNYSAVTTRKDVGLESSGGPQEDEPAPKKGKK